MAERIYRLVKLVWNLDNKREIELQSLAKLELKESEKENLRKILAPENFSSEDYIALKRLKIAAPVYNNILDNPSLPVHPEIKMLITSLQIRKIVLDREFRRIMTVIGNNNLEVFPVKGSVTSQLYNNNHLRVHLDYDFVALSETDAFKLAALIIQDGYHFLCDGSVPISIKIIQNIKDIDQFSGHFHLEKIIYDKYQMIIDINFPGFPAGKDHYIYYTNNNKKKWDYQFIIALCHIFKHDRVYVKDINDIVLMFRSNLISLEEINDLIKINNLGFYYNIVIKYIKKNYNIPTILNNKISLSASIFSELLIILGWPYSRKFHLYAKIINNLQYIFKSFKWNKLKNNKMKKHDFSICKNGTFLERIYLFPLIVFSKFTTYDCDKLNNFEHLSDGTIHLIKYDNVDLALLPIGIFLVSSFNSISCDKLHITAAVQKLKNIFEIKEDIIRHGAVREARKELWLF